MSSVLAHRTRPTRTLRYHKSARLPMRRRGTLGVRHANPTPGTPAFRTARRRQQRAEAAQGGFTLEELTRAVEHVAAHFEGAPPDDFVILGLRSYAYAVWASLNDPTGKTLRAS